MKIKPENNPGEEKSREKKPKGFRRQDPLEVYLVAADNPVGKRQLRPILRRKRSGEVLTREQVNAIKRGRKLLRKEMKERGLKRRIDFETTATNLGLYFDRNRFLWPFFLWLIKDNTVAKILATTAVLTTVITVTEPVIEYITQYVTQYVTEYVNEYITEYIDKYIDRIIEEYVPEYIREIWEKDRFTIKISDDMQKKGLEISENNQFNPSSEVLTCNPAWDMPCLSISNIPVEVLNSPDGENHGDYFSYTFYCRYINLDAELLAQGKLQEMNENGMEAIYPLLEEYKIDYEWALMIGNESLQHNDSAVALAADDDGAAVGGADGLQLSDAIWAMVIEDDERVILCSKGRDDGGVEKLPTDEVYSTKGLAYMDRSLAYINRGLAKIDPAITTDNVAHLEELYQDEDELAYYSAQVERYLEEANIADLTRLMLRTDNAGYSYRELAVRGDYSYYQVYPEAFESSTVMASKHRTEMLPYLRPEKFSGSTEQVQKALEEQTSVHKYTVIVWLEGDDPECVNALMNGHISLNFQIKGDEEDFITEIVTPTAPTETTEATEGEAA